MKLAALLLAAFLGLPAHAGVTIYMRYVVPSTHDISSRPANAYLYFYCDTEAELPSTNVVNGDRAYTVDTGKRWNRTGGAWVLQTIEGVSDSIQTGTTVLNVGTITDGEYLKRDGGNIVSAAVAGGGVPAGMIAAFNAACPSGWTELTAARGRVIVGVPASGTLAATVGTALTDAQDKSVTPTFTGTPFTDIINHTHPVTDPGHTHVITELRDATTGGVTTNIALTADTSSTIGTKVTGSRTTGITTANPVGGVASITPAGTVSAVALSSVIATLQLRYCSKD